MVVSQKEQVDQNLTAALQLRAKEKDANEARWKVIADVAVERVQNAVDLGAPSERIRKLAFEARGAQMDLESVQRRGRPLNRRERRAIGLEPERVPNGYRPGAR